MMGVTANLKKQLFQGVSKLTESNKNQHARIVNIELVNNLFNFRSCETFTKISSGSQCEHYKLN